MSKKAPVTEHALYRFIERVIGINMEAAKRHMLTPEIRSAIKVGAASYTQNGFTYIIEGGKVITVCAGSAKNTRRPR